MLTVIRLDADGVAVEELVDFESLEWTESVGASGASMQCDDTLAALLVDGGLLLEDSTTGHAWSCHTVESKVQAGQRGQVTFDSDLTWLAKVQPHPSPIDLNTATQSHDVLTGAANTVLASLINRNAGPDAHISRRRDWTVTSTGTVAPTTTIRARWTPSILEWIQRKGVPNGVAVTLVRDGVDGSAAVTVRGVDELDLVFADNNLSVLDWTRTVRSPTVTHLWAGGTGEGAARLIRYDDRPDGPRLEGFLDRRNVADSAELDQEIVEALELGRRSVSLEVSLGERDDARFGADFLLGDLVQVWIGDEAFTEPVTAVRSKVTGAGVERVVTVGFGAVDPRVRGQVEARRAAARVDDLEGEA